MTHAYIAHRSATPTAHEHHVVIVGGVIKHKTNTQKDAAEWAIRQGYSPHVARERHLQNTDIPAHWRKYP